MKGYLVLADGTVFQGEPFGAAGATPGEVVFNTGMTGYQEVLTDPSYAGQIVCMTYPLIGNYGINPFDFESRRPFVRGFVIKELCTDPSHWQAAQGLDGYLREAGIPGLAAIDTRALTRHLRVLGTMNGVLVTAGAEAVSAAGLPAAPDGAGRDLDAPGGLVRTPEAWRVDVPPALADWFAALSAHAGAWRLEQTVPEVTTPEAYHLAGAGGGGKRVVVADYGVKQNILRHLMGMGVDVAVMPADTPASGIMALQPDGVMLSNGPGDPKENTASIQAVRDLLEVPGLPVFGICLGHQVLGLALGADTYKLKFGHRGANHPVKDFITGRVYITSQNHGYAIDEQTLPPGVEVTHRNLNDGTVEGLVHRDRPVWSVQYHPEAAPGPEESRYLFEGFIHALKGGN